MLNKSVLILITSIIIFFLLIGVSVFYLNYNYSSEIKTNVIEEKHEFIIKNSEEYLKNCEEIENSEDKSICYIQEAGIKKSIEICNNKVSNNDKIVCYMDVAISSRDAGICDLTGFSEECKDIYSSSTLELDYCSKEIFCNVINETINKFSINENDCKTLSLKARNSGFLGKNDIELKENCYMFLSEIEKEPSYCDNIKNEDKFYECFELSRQEYNHKDCTLNEGYGYKKDFCYYKLAKQENSTLLCNSIQTSVLNLRCLEKI